MLSILLLGMLNLTLIKPFIEVAVNPDTTPPKLFSNSRSNNGRQQYEDLSGVMYSDIPLLVQPNESLEANGSTLAQRLKLRKTFTSSWYGRLFIDGAASTNESSRWLYIARKYRIAESQLRLRRTA